MAEVPQHQEKQNPTRSMGGWMLVMAWLLGLGLLALWFHHWNQAQMNPNQNVSTLVSAEGVQRVVLKRNRYNHYVASGKINGKTVTFFLDTGATSVVVPEHLAAELQLKPGAPVQVSTANGAITAYATQIQQLQLGNMLFHDVRANINPSDDNKEILLGMSVLKQVDFTQKGDTLILTMPLTEQ